MSKTPLWKSRHDTLIQKTHLHKREKYPTHNEIAIRIHHPYKRLHLVNPRRYFQFDRQSKDRNESQKQ